MTGDPTLEDNSAAGDHFAALLAGAVAGKTWLRAFLVSRIGVDEAVADGWFRGETLPEPAVLPLIACALDLDVARVAIVWLAAREPILELPLTRLGLRQGDDAFLKMLEIGALAVGRQDEVVAAA